MGYVITDSVTGRSYDTDRDGYGAVAQALETNPERFYNVSNYEKKQILDGAHMTGYRSENSTKSSWF